MLRETVRFWNAFLHEDKEAQRWVSSPSYSPEHGPISIGNTYDQSLIWQLFHDFIQAAQELGLDEDLLTEVKEKFDLLNPLQITQSGRIREWYEEEEQHFQNEKVESQHRHASHLVGLYPGNLFSHKGKNILMRRVIASMIVEMGEQAGPRLIRSISGRVWEMAIEPINY